VGWGRCVLLVWAWATEAPDLLRHARWAQGRHGPKAYWAMLPITVASTTSVCAPCTSPGQGEGDGGAVCRAGQHTGQVSRG